MTKYNKLFGSIVGGLIGAAASFGLPTEWATAEVQSALVILVSAVFTYFVPANKVGL